MSKESARAFVARLLEDEAFLRKFASVKGQGRKQAAAEEGFEFTTEELQEAKAEHLQEAGTSATRTPPGRDNPQPLYGVVDTWES